MPATETYRGYEIHPDVAGYGFLAHMTNNDGSNCIHGWSAKAVRAEIDAHISDEGEFFPIADMAAWANFCAANADALEEIGSPEACFAMAKDCSLLVGGGAAPLFRVGFVDGSEFTNQMAVNLFDAVHAAKVA